MCRLLMIFGQSGGEPWDGKNAGLVQGLTAGPHHIQLTGGSFLSVPGPIAAQIARRAPLDVVDTPQGACGRHDETERMGADEALPLPALIAPQPSAGLGVTEGNVHGPAVAIRVSDILGAYRQSGGEKGFDGWGWFAVPGLCGGGCARTPQPHDPHEAPRQPRVPQSIPGVDLGARCAGVG